MRFVSQSSDYVVTVNDIVISKHDTEAKAKKAAEQLVIEYHHDYVVRLIADIPIPSLFPTTFWSQIKRRNVSPNSDVLVADLIRQCNEPGSPWLNIMQYSTPVYVVDSKTPKVPVSIVQNGYVLNTLELHKKLQLGVPVPDYAIPAQGSDGHLTIIDVDERKLYEFWVFEKKANGWQSAWGGVIDNIDTSNGVMPIVNGENWGATATSLPAVAGTILLQELKAGIIPHMLAFAVQDPKWDFIPPAPRTDGGQNGANGLIPAGQIFQLPADIVIDNGWTPMTKMMVAAVRDYGMILRDRSGCTNFYAEDPTPYGLGEDAYRPYFGGRELWDVVQQFPFNQLKAVGF